METELEAPEERRSFLLRQTPYLVALFLALVGVAYSNISRQPLRGYWEFMALAMGVLCVVVQWDSAPDRSGRLRMIGKQALHWAAVLVAMNIMVLDSVQSQVPPSALGLVLLTMLALGAFLAGVGLMSPQICFLGFAMALAVPAIAWLTQSFLFIVLALLLLIGIGVAVWPLVAPRRRQPRREDKA